MQNTEIKRNYDRRLRTKRRNKQKKNRYLAFHVSKHVMFHINNTISANEIDYASLLLLLVLVVVHWMHAMILDIDSVMYITRFLKKEDMIFLRVQ